MENTSNEEMLQSVRQAIVQITLGGQSYAIGSRKLTRADLKTLMQLEDKLLGAIAADNAQDSHLMDDTYVAVFNEGR